MISAQTQRLACLARGVPPEPHPSWPRPWVGWVFVHHPMSRCSGVPNRCTVERIENGRVIWNAETEDAAARGGYSTPLFTFAASMADGQYSTYRDPKIFRLTPKGCTCP